MTTGTDQKSPPKTTLWKARRALGWTVHQVAEAVGTRGSTISRLERGVYLPKRDLARRVWSFYRGEVPLSEVYDPLFDPTNTSN